MIYLLKAIALGSSRAIVLPLPLLSALDIGCGDILAVKPDKSGAFHIERAPGDLLRPRDSLFDGKAGQPDDSEPHTQKLAAVLKSLKARHRSKKKETGRCPDSSRPDALDTPNEPATTGPLGLAHSPGDQPGPELAECQASLDGRQISG
jgi:hypothetical protein